MRTTYRPSEPVDELLERPIPEKLWHYTSIQGFQGIVASKRIWATDLRFLNDREEFIHARNIANRVVAASPELDENEFPNREILAKVVTFVLDSKLLTLTDFRVFVASFSAAEDQLGQWRAYSRGSSGVSLAFDLKALRPPYGNGALMAFAPCVYDTVEKEKLLWHVLHHFKERIGKVASKDKEQVVKEFLEADPSKTTPETFGAPVGNSRLDYLRIAALLKHSSFEEEKEWRLALPLVLREDTMMKRADATQFRVEKTTLVPYVAHPFSWNETVAAESIPLVDIILGPGSDENSVFAAQKFLNSHGFRLKPRLSKVPYRAS